jgi:putative oxidoreductase
VGLILLRLVAGGSAIARGIAGLKAGPSMESAILEVIGMAAGALLLPGLWTVIVGTVLAALELWNVFSGQPVSVQPADPWASILLGTIGAALALLGPGAWSVDARIFGWRRIELGHRTR